MTLAAIFDCDGVLVENALYPREYEEFRTLRIERTSAIAESTRLNTQFA
jgi:beta-phosphoglucomutase-like phosphatase (HAD superfamily)